MRPLAKTVDWPPPDELDWPPPDDPVPPADFARERLAREYLASAGNVTQAAKATGVSVYSARKMLAEPEVKEIVKTQQEEILDHLGVTVPQIAGVVWDAAKVCLRKRPIVLNPNSPARTKYAYDDEGNLMYEIVNADGAARLLGMLVKMVGAEAPSRVEVTGRDGEAIQFELSTVRQNITNMVARLLPKVDG